MINISFSGDNAAEIFKNMSEFAMACSGNSPMTTIQANPLESPASIKKTRSKSKNLVGATGVEPVASTETVEPQPDLFEQVPQAEISAKKLTMDDCRDALTALNSAKGMGVARAVVAKMGVERIGALPEEKFEQFVRECEIAQTQP